MTTTPAASAASAQLAVAVQQIEMERRPEFDEAVRKILGIATPIPEASEAFLATDDHEAVLGVAYLRIQHIVDNLHPLETLDAADRHLVEGQLLGSISQYLRDMVRETVMRLKDSQIDVPRGLAYDVYVPDGQPGPDGFERLVGVSVWRKRVC